MISLSRLKEMEEEEMENKIKELKEKLSSKEQECEELKENLPNAITRLMGELDQLKAENDELKEELEELKEENEYNEANAIEFKQTLTEIKEIARVGAFYWKHYKEESKRYNEILQKISECEV